MDKEGASVAERRINLWRRAIFLFSRTTQEEGPFFTAGYLHYWCEGKSIEKKTPDIFGFSDNFYAVCDISMSPQKGELMQKYHHCTPSDYMKRVLGISGKVDSNGYPFLITDEYEIAKYPGYNLIQLNGCTEINIELINDPKLNNVLNQWQGFLTVPPSFQLMAVPESTLEELKKPIATILKWATQFEDWNSSEIVVERLLGHLYNSFSLRSKSSLRKSVELILYGLSQRLLKGFLLYNSSENLLHLK